MTKLPTNYILEGPDSTPEREAEMTEMLSICARRIPDGSRTDELGHVHDLMIESFNEICKIHHVKVSEMVVLSAAFTHHVFKLAHEYFDKQGFFTEIRRELAFLKSSVLTAFHSKKGNC